ncbi:MAG: hypothetical protein JO362_15450 [Streptomycetaceae bacterium]|nr:hypothetical protein [Streptomycetaceae bacterium]
MLSGALAGVLSFAAVAALTSCAGSDGSGGALGSADASSRNGTLSAASPGKYQTLPEPCGSVSSQTLHAMLPGSQNYAGTAALTYDPDRRVGCQWSGTTQDGTRHLSLDFERVVSYDPTFSDDDKAVQDYEQMAQAAHIPGVDPSISPSPSTPAPTSSPSPSLSPSPSPSPSPSNSTAASDAAEASDTTPRRIGGIGDTAYLNDTVTAMDSVVHRDVTVVFRIANVLVTVEFSQQSNDKTVIPSSMELQLDALGLAQQLAASFNS